MNNSATKRKQNLLSTPLGYLLIVGGTMILGFLSGLLSGSNRGYTGFTRPPLTPPDTVFAIVWPVLYFMIGNSLFFILKSEPSASTFRIRRISIILWIIQLALNLAWPFIFFAASLPTFAFIVLSLLDAAVLALIIFTFMLDKTAAWLLIPYGVWIAFATYLNLFIALYN